MKIKYIALLFILFFFISKIMADRPVRVFITAGQSNTAGRVKNNLLPIYIKSLSTDTIDYLTGAYNHCLISQNDKKGGFVPYWPKGRITDGLWTYDAVTYHNIEKTIQEDFYVIKWAVGGAFIGFPTDSTNGRFWSADSTWITNAKSVEEGGSSLLLSLVESIENCIDNTLSKVDNGYRFDAFLWNQGESDDKYSSNYYKNMSGVIKYVRNFLSNKTGHDYSELPFVFGSIPKASRSYNDEINYAMTQIAEEDDNVFMVDLSNCGLQSDMLHFNEVTAEYLGVEMFRILHRKLNLSNTHFRIAKYKNDESCAISYTFDDGLSEHYSLVAPQLEKRGFRGTFWINGSKINPSQYNIKDTTRMNWKQLVSLSDIGHEISNHGWAHKNFSRFPIHEIKEDVYKNDSAIYINTGIMPTTFCYPNNNKESNGMRIAIKDRVGTRIKQQSIGSKSTPESLDLWVNKTHRNKGLGRRNDTWTDIWI